MPDTTVPLYWWARPERTEVLVQSHTERRDRRERSQCSASARANVFFVLILSVLCLFVYVWATSRAPEHLEPAQSAATSRAPKHPELGQSAATSRAPKHPEPAQRAATSRAAQHPKPAQGEVKSRPADQSVSRHREKRQGSSCQEDICLTAECVHAASSFLSALNTQVDPCHDFYEYACGGWIKKHLHKTGDEALFYGVIHNIMPEMVDSELSQLLKTGEGIPEVLLDTKPYRDLFFFYQSCLDVDDQSERDMRPVFEMLKTKEEFQVGRHFEAERWNLTRALVQMLRMNGAPLFDVIVDADIHNSSRYSIVISAPLHSGLIPALVAHSRRTRGRPGFQEFLRDRGSQALFGGRPDDGVLLRRLRDLNPEAKSASAVMDGDDSPVVNLVSAHDMFPAKDSEENAVQKEVGDKSSSSDLFTTASSLPTETVTSIHTTTRVPTAETTIVRTPTEPARTPATTRISTQVPTSTRIPTQVPATTSTTTQTPASPQAPTTTTRTPSKASRQPTTATHPPTTTPMTPEDEEDIKMTGIDEDYPTGLLTNVTDTTSLPLVSRRDVYNMFKMNMKTKRTDGINKMIQEHLIPGVNAGLADDVADGVGEHLFTLTITSFVEKLAEIQPDERDEIRSQQQGSIYHTYTLHQLQHDFPLIEWRYLLEELFQKTITDEDRILVYYPDYLLRLCNIISDVDPWVLHYGLLAVYIYDVLLETVSASDDTDRQSFCLQATKNVFGEVMSNMYLHHVGNHTINTIRAHTTSILALLREEVEMSIRSSEWLSSEEQLVALSKLHSLHAEVGAFENHWNISYVNESHSKIRFQPGLSFLEAVQEVYRVFRLELYHLYQTPIERRAFIWSFTVQPYIVNAFHMQSTNSIVFPEAFFHPPFYHARGPEYLNYGSAANSMAHEIFHGLDFNGMLYDARGDLTRPFSEAARARLNVTVQCYHDLLSRAFYEEVSVQHANIAMEIDSSATLNENLADIAGIRHAYRAYQKWVERNHIEPRLPAIPLSPSQLFFVSAAQPYCAVIPDVAKIFLMEMDEHLPDGMRINALMMNTPEFAEVFNCSADSRMVASETCHTF
ncbi:uncharacterized protein [Procambarus clarkii]|uniref:uncharacterized protein n=1 Tax=Procambarus clarkii TaxID=6728 RepID=UPI0037437D2C